MTSGPQARRGDRDRDLAPLEHLLRGPPGLDAAGGRAVVGAEHHHRRALGCGQAARPDPVEGSTTTDRPTSGSSSHVAPCRVAGRRRAGRSPRDAGRTRARDERRPATASPRPRPASGRALARRHRSRSRHRTRSLPRASAQSSGMGPVLALDIWTIIVPAALYRGRRVRVDRRDRADWRVCDHRTVGVIVARLARLGLLAARVRAVALSPTSRFPRARRPTTSGSRWPPPRAGSVSRDPVSRS